MIDNPFILGIGIFATIDLILIIFIVGYLLGRKKSKEKELIVAKGNEVPQKTVNTPPFPHFALYLILFFVMFLLVSGSFYLGKNVSFTPKAAEPTPTPSIFPTVNLSSPTEVIIPSEVTYPTAKPTVKIISPTATIIPTQSGGVINFDDLVATIGRNINQKTVENLRPYMANKVTKAIMSSGCCEGDSVEDALSFIRGYVNEHSGPWIYDQNDSKINSIRAADYTLEYYLMVISSDNALIAFRLNVQNKIVGVSYTRDYHLVTGGN